MFVAVEGAWLAVAGQIAFRRPAITKKTLAFHKQQFSQFAGGIVDKYQLATFRCPSFKPVMWRTVYLHQFPKACPSLPHLVCHHLAGFLGFPQTFCQHQLPDTLV